MTGRSASEEVKRKRVRRGSVVDARFQGRFVVLLLLPVVVLVFGLWLNARVYVQASARMVREVGLRDEASGDRLRLRLDDAVRRFSLVGSALALSLVAVTAAVGLKASHRLSGPVGRLARHARVALRAPAASAPIGFRRKDYLEDLAASLNGADEAVRRRREELRARLILLCDQAEQLEVARGNEAVAARICEMEATLRGLASLG